MQAASKADSVREILDWSKLYAGESACKLVALVQIFSRSILMPWGNSGFLTRLALGVMKWILQLLQTKFRENAEL
jgi:hypothetical protein